MQSLGFEYERSALYVFLLLALLLFLFFRALNILKPLILKGPKLISGSIEWLPVAELGAWIFFMVWGIQYFLKTNPLFALGLFIVITTVFLIIAWMSLRDVIGGIIFRVFSGFRISDTIEIDGIKGNINAMKVRSLQLETPHGELIYFPYSRIIGKHIVKTNPAEQIHRHSFKLTLPKTGSLSNARSSLQSLIMQLPNVSPREIPRITAENITDDAIEFSVTISLIDSGKIQETEERVREISGEKIINKLTKLKT